MSLAPITPRSSAAVIEEALARLGWTMPQAQGYDVLQCIHPVVIVGGGIAPEAINSLVSPSVTTPAAGATTVTLIVPAAGVEGVATRGMPIIMRVAAQTVGAGTATRRFILAFAGKISFELEEIRYTFTTAAAAPTTFPWLSLYPLSAPAVTGTANTTDPQSWTTIKPNPAATTAYYGRHRKGIVAPANEDVDAEFSLDGGVTRTLWMNAPLPDLPIWGGGGIELAMTAAAAVHQAATAADPAAPAPAAPARTVPTGPTRTETT